MVQAIPRFLTFEQFLDWEELANRSFELVDGMPVPVSEPNANHEDLAARLCRYLEQLCERLDLPYVARLSKQIRLKSKPEERERSRKADIVVFDRAEWLRLKQSPSPAAAYVVPPMVIEVVSNNWRDDYLTKLAEYEALGIGEFWIVDYAAFGASRYTGDPKMPTLWVNVLVDGDYQVNVFRGDDRVISPTFPDLDLSANQIFAMAR